MTVEAAEKMWSLDNLRFASQNGRNRTADITVGYSVVAEPDDPIEDVLTAADLPQMTDAYPGYPQIHVVNIDPQRLSPVYYIVTVRYYGEAGPIGFGGDADPENTPPTLQWKNLTSEEEISEAFKDNSDEIVSIATVNGEPVHGITERITDFVAVIERNYAFGAFDLPTLHKYLRSVNDDDIVTSLGTFGPGLARLTKFEPTEVYAEEFGGYIKVSAEITFRLPVNTDDDPKKAWWKRYLHEGYIMRVRADTAPADGSEDRLVNITDGNKDRSISPIHLNEDGFPIDDPLDPDTPPHYRRQRTVYELPYAALGLF